MMNVGYHYILAEFGRPVTEKTLTANTVASQQFYQLPMDYLFLKTVTVTVGGVPYVVTEEESQENWDLMNSSSQQTGDIPIKFFLRPGFEPVGAEIGLWPTPASANNTITAIYETTDKDLSQNKYVTGTVTVTNGSAAVVGSGTTFTASMVGRYFEQSDATGDNLFYKVASYTDATHITLGNTYGGATIAGAGYQIAEMFKIPESMQILPCYYAAMEYWGVKNDQGEHDKYKAKFDEGMLLGKRRYATKSRSALTRGGQYMSRWRAWAPFFFPGTVAS